MTQRILIGDVRARLAELPDESAHCVVTSPPYWGLRDYGTATWAGGDPACDHQPPPRQGKGARSTTNDHGKPTPGTGDHDQPYRDACRKCGARRIDAQLGLEATPDEYVANMVAVFCEVRRVLRADGVLFLNLDDSYTSGGRDTFGPPGNNKNNDAIKSVRRAAQPSGLKPKDLCGIPWRVAFALQMDGWYLRQDVIWSKPNPMPESVTDRCTKAHEYIFLLTKSARYYWDQEAVKETGVGRETYFGSNAYSKGSGRCDAGSYNDAICTTRNPRSVWTIATRAYPEAHFATFPEAIPERCIKAGTSERGCCPTCGAPWVRIMEKTDEPDTSAKGSRFDIGKTGARDGGDRTQPGERTINRTTGWRPTCDHGGEPVPCVVLDPFLGSGTTLAVAAHLGRSGIGIELNPEYAKLAQDRIGRGTRPDTHRSDDAGDAPLFVEAAP